MPIGRFCGGIGALLWYPPDHTYLLLRRSLGKDFGGGVWECVTGRVDQGEGFEDALRREVAEEVGVEIQIEFIVGTTHFYRGEAKPENELIGVTYCCSITDPGAIRLSAEHDAYRWVSAAQADDMLTADDPGTRWIRRVIERAEAMQGLIPPALRLWHQRHGLELL